MVKSLMALETNMGAVTMVVAGILLVSERREDHQALA